MKIAIHNRPGSFSDRWIEYCNENNIAYKLVNCYDNDIIDQLKDCNALMWHHHHAGHKDILFAKQLLYSLEQAGKKVFPDFNTGWHFDDKLGQKYLLESIGAPLVPSYVFHTKNEALEWVNIASFPKVFKLRGGAGSSNVKLVKSKNHAEKLVKKAFKKGFPQYDKWNSLKERIRKVKESKVKYLEIFKGIGRYAIPMPHQWIKGNEKGYVYFQEFIPGNEFDIRVIVVNNRAFAIKRLNRSNDFRASGSGDILYKKENFDDKTIAIAFKIAKQLQTQCCAFDFVFDENNNPLIVEISYGFTMKVYEPCVGYWDENLDFYEASFNPYGWMVEFVI